MIRLSDDAACYLFGQMCEQPLTGSSVSLFPSSVAQKPPQRLVAGVLPHTAERTGLRLSAEPAEPPLQTDVRPAAELQQQAAHAEEPPGGAAAGEPQGSSQMTTPPLEKSHFTPPLLL